MYNVLCIHIILFALSLVSSRRATYTVYVKYSEWPVLSIVQPTKWTTVVHRATRPLHDTNTAAAESATKYWLRHLCQVWWPELYEYPKAYSRNPLQSSRRTFSGGRRKYSRGYMRLPPGTFHTLITLGGLHCLHTQHLYVFWPFCLETC